MLVIERDRAKRRTKQQANTNSHSDTNSSSKNTIKKSQKQADNDVINDEYNEDFKEFSKEGKEDLLKIEKLVRKFENPDDDTVKCFCRARLHPLSEPPTRCPKCALILCNLNTSPIICPSCSFKGLLTTFELQQQLSLYKSSKREIINIERDRLKVIREDKKRMRKRVQYPSLPTSTSTSTSSSNQKKSSGYASNFHSIDDKINKSYEEMERKHQVLSLDSKTKTLKAQKSQLVESHDNPNTHEDDINVIPSPDDNDLSQPFIDPYDDGIASW